MGARPSARGAASSRPLPRARRLAGLLLLPSLASGGCPSSCRAREPAPAPDRRGEAPVEPGREPTPLGGEPELLGAPGLQLWNLRSMPGALSRVSTRVLEPGPGQRSRRPSDQLLAEVDSRLTEVQGCHEARLLAGADVAGRLELRFPISEGGAVDASQASASRSGSLDLRLERCVLGKAGLWRFAPEETEGLTELVCVFDLEKAAPRTGPERSPR